MTSIKHFNMEEVSIKRFCAFCKNNIPLLITVTIALFFSYGIRLFWYSIGIDTELFMANKQEELKWFTQIGRFGLSVLSRLWYINEFNPFTAFFTAFCFIWFFTISWCYIIAIFSKDTGRNNNLIPFALVFMTMPIWAEQFYFLLQAAENAFILSLCPYIVYLLYKGFLDNEKGKIACAFVLLVFITSVYQAIVPMFICGVFICFLLLQENSDYKPQVYRRLCLQLFITLVCSLVFYFFIDRIIIPGIFGIEKSEYLDNMNRWGQIPIRENIINILVFGYIITIGNIPQVQAVVNPIVAQYARTGMQAAEAINSMSIFGNVLLLPITLLFLVNVIFSMRKIIPQGRRLLYTLAGIGIPFCIMLLSVMGGDRPPIRAMYALPLAFAFMFFFLIRKFNKKVSIAFVCLALSTAMYQAQITAQLFYSDHVRYNEDVRLASEIYKLVTGAQPEGEMLPVALIGKYQMSSKFHSNKNFLQGNVLGHSNFEWVADNTIRGLSFMETLGMSFLIANEKQREQAFLEAELMPWYPDPNCVKRIENFIVVRISEVLY